MKEFGENPGNKFSQYYNFMHNSCIDYVMKALQEGGINPTGSEGVLLPTWNAGHIKRMRNWYYNGGGGGLAGGSGGGDNAGGASWDSFGNGAGVRPSPLVLDLDGDGVETINAFDGAHFDHDGNGFAERTGWAGADDGILVMDRNGDGIINDGKELFGNETLLANGINAANGFAALAALDGNADGIINANDASFADLKIWVDEDGDGYSLTEELHTLDELGIQSIATGFTESTFVDPQGNAHKQVGTFTKTDGTIGTATDVWFQADKLYTIPQEWLDVPDEIIVRPDLTGYGNVHDLHQAMVRDASGGLKTLVEQFMATPDTASRENLMQQILFKWTGSDTISPTSRGSYFDARKLTMLEKFFGEPYVGTTGPNPNNNAPPYLNQSYRGMFELYYGQLMAQTHLKDLYNAINYTWDNASQSIQGSLSGTIADIQARIAIDPVAGEALLFEFARTIVGQGVADMLHYHDLVTAFPGFADKLEFLPDTFCKNVFTGTNGNNSLTGTRAGDALNGGAGNDTISGADDHDSLYGGSGADTLKGGTGNDIFDGGTGNDTLYGYGTSTTGAGNDTYRFGVGSGVDTIYDKDSTAGNTDSVAFKEGVRPEDVRFRKEGNHLRVALSNGVDSLLINNWFSSSANRIEKFVFADGTILTDADLDVRGYEMLGTGGNDTLTGSNCKDFIFGNNGNDTLSGANGDDVIDGGDGTDTIKGGNGNDVLDGGAGGDILYGGAPDFSDSGNDTYKFGLGSGADMVYDYGSGNGNQDTVEFKEGVTPEDVSFRVEPTISPWTLEPEVLNLRVMLASGQDSMLINDWFRNENYRIERFVFADGTVITASEVEARGYQVVGTGGDDILIGSYFKDILLGNVGNDTLSGCGGNNVFDGGPGNDILYACTSSPSSNYDTGSQTYRFGIGDGLDTIYDNDRYNSAGNIDTVEFKQGVAPGDVSFRVQGWDLRVALANGEDSLLIKGWFSDKSYRIERFVFADGSIVTEADLDACGYSVVGTSGNDSLSGSRYKDVLFGNDGDDKLFGGDGGDVLDGGAGNDMLYGNADYPIPEYGPSNDTYRFGMGSGRDTIYESATEAPGDQDSVEFGVNPLDLIFSRSEDNLTVSIANTQDQLTIWKWYFSPALQIESFETSDGKMLSNSDVDLLIQSMSAFCANEGLTWSQAIEQRPQDVQIVLAQYWSA
jgi:Ca2+-binding RTX toxin-like protein